MELEPGTVTKEEVSPEAIPSTEPGTEVKPEVKEEVKPEVKGNPEPETKKDIMIPKERFDEVNGKYKELAGQLEQMQKDKEDMEKLVSSLKESSDASTSSVKETAEKLEGQVKKYESLIENMVEAKVKTIPEEYTELIPEGLSSEQKLAWITKAEEKGLFKKEKVKIGEPLNHSSDQEQSEKIKKMNPLQLFASYYSNSGK